jgi:hypothetical protein
MSYLSEFTISGSQKREDYEILIKQKYNSGYLAYCPQLNRLIKGDAFDTVYYDMDEIIVEHINAI